MQRPKIHAGLRHVALHIKNLEACVRFYTELLGFKIVWQPDNNNCYLSSGTDNLALHRAPIDFVPGKFQHLDHLGLFLTTKESVDEWHDFMVSNGIKISAPPKDHRDGTRSFYLIDPDGNIVQMIYYPV